MTTVSRSGLADGLVPRALRGATHPLVGEADDYDPLLTLIGEARFVLLGEASHGTHEFYRERARITKRLVREKGFTGVAVETDGPGAYRVNRFVRGRGDDAGAIDALAGFRRFPAWMWLNADVLDFVGWLRAHNNGGVPGRTEAEGRIPSRDRADAGPVLSARKPPPGTRPAGSTAWPRADAAR